MLEYSQTFRFPDGGERLPLRALFSALETDGGEHEELLGRGKAFFRAINASWVLVSQRAAVSRLPRPGETVRIETWPGPARLALYSRYYRLTDTQGRELLRTASLWSVLELTRRRILSPGQSGVPAFETVTGLETPLAGHIPTVQEASETTRTVRAEDIDANGHMNNALYLNWVESVLPADAALYDRLEELTTVYKKEMLLGQTADLRVRRTAAETTIQAVQDGKPAFTARLNWKTDKGSAENG